MANKPGTVVELESPPVGAGRRNSRVEPRRRPRAAVSGSRHVAVLPRASASDRRRPSARPTRSPTVSSDMDQTRRRRTPRNCLDDPPSVSSLHGERGARHAPRRDDDHTLLHRRAATDGERPPPPSPRRPGIDRRAIERPEIGRSARQPIACRRQSARIARPTRSSAVFAAPPMRCTSPAMDAKRCGRCRVRVTDTAIPGRSSRGNILRSV